MGLNWIAPTLRADWANVARWLMSRLCQCLVDDTEGKRFTAAGTDGNTVCKDNRLSAEINEHRVQLPQRHFLLIFSSCGHLQLQRKTLSDFPSHPQHPSLRPILISCLSVWQAWRCVLPLTMLLFLCGAHVSDSLDHLASLPTKQQLRVANFNINGGISYLFSHVLVGSKHPDVVWLCFC